MKRKFLCAIAILWVLFSPVWFILGYKTAEKIVNIAEKSEVEMTKNSATDTFVLVSDNEDIDRVFYCRDTRSDTMFIGFNSNKTGIIQMIDPNTGCPLTYDNWLKYKENDK